MIDQSVFTSTNPLGGTCPECGAPCTVYHTLYHDEVQGRCLHVYAHGEEPVDHVGSQTARGGLSVTVMDRGYQFDFVFECRIPRSDIGLPMWKYSESLVHWNCWMS